MFIQDSRRSYRTYSYTEVLIHVMVFISIFYLPQEFTELILMLRSLHLLGGTGRYHRDYGTYTGFAELNLIREYP